MAPLELPGFYFDETRNRYFPLSQKPRPLAFSPSPSASVPAKRRAPSSANSTPSHRAARAEGNDHDDNDDDIDVCHRRDKRGICTRPRDGPWRALMDARATCAGTRRRRDKHVLDCARVASTSGCRVLAQSSGSAALGALAVHESEDGRVRVFAGDTGGFIRSVEAPSQDFAAYCVGAPDLRYSWLPEHCIQYPTLSIHRSRDKVVATGEGADFRVFLRDTRTEAAVVASYPSKIVQNVNATDLYEHRLALGAQARACVVPDIDQLLQVRTYRTKSDVLSLCQEHDLLYTGLRNGALVRFDLRAPYPRSDDDTPPPLLHRPTPLVHLARVRDWELIVAGMDGTIDVVDLRFRAPTPLLSLHGHANAWRHDLPLAITPAHDALFAAGLDARVRAWSLRTGAPLTPPPPCDISPSPPTVDAAGPSRRACNPLATQFAQPPAALCSAELGGEACLLAAAGREVLLWTLGRTFEGALV